MSDEFLYRLRVSPPPKFAARLKLRLDAQGALQARRRTVRRLSVIAGVFVAGTAFAVMAPSVRDFAFEVLGLKARERTAETAAVGDDANVRRMPVSPFTGPARNGGGGGGAGPENSSQGSTSFNPYARTDRPAALEIAPPEPRATPAPDEQSARGALNVSTPITLAGSRSVVPLTNAIVAKYKQHANRPARLAIDHPDTVVALGKFCRNELDMVHSVRPLDKNERVQCTSYGIEYLELPVAYEALVVVTSRQNIWANALAPSDLAKIDRGGRWSSLNPQWPNVRWTLYSPGGDSTDTFSPDALVAGWSRRAGVTVRELTDLTLRVFRDPNAIAYLPYVDFEGKQNVRAVPIVNSRGVAVQPSRASIEDATYEPLSRPVFLYVNARAVDRAEVAEFVEFYLTQGTMAIAEAKFLPLAASTYGKALRNFHIRKIGTVFAESPGLGVPVDKLLDREAQRYAQ